VPFQQKLEVRRTDPSLPLWVDIPEEKCNSLFCNNIQLHESQIVLRGDETYVRYALPEGASLSIQLATAVPFWTPAILMGCFSAKSQREGDWDHLAMENYQLNMYEPLHEQIIVSPENRTIRTDVGWQCQGRPFYSGTAVYDLGEVDIPAGAVLELPNVGGSAELLVDDQSRGWTCLTPQEFNLKELAGRHYLKLRCSNTFANFMERYLAPSGLEAAPRLVVVQP
jgi:hypothetical protein